MSRRRPKLLVVAQYPGETEIFEGIRSHLTAGFDVVFCIKGENGVSWKEIENEVAQCDAVFTGLHATGQRELARGCRSHEVPCFGLIEMCLPSSRHDADKSGSQLRQTAQLCTHLLVPDALTKTARERYPKAHVVAYGAPEPVAPRPENRWVERDGNRWRLTQTSRGAAASGPVCFVGQHHAENWEVFNRLLPLVREWQEAQTVCFLEHPSDDTSKPSMPGVRVLPKDAHLEKHDAVAHARLVVTEYSNLGYSLALAGVPVLYTYADPPGGGCPLEHLSVLLGRQKQLPVRHALPTRDAVLKSLDTLPWAVEAPQPRLRMNDLLAALRAL